MSAADDGNADNLHAGGRLPSPGPERTSDTTATDAAPAASGALPSTADQVPTVREAAWIPPARPSPLGEQPAHRRGVAGRTAANRARSVVLIAVAIAAAVPLVLGMAAVRIGPALESLHPSPPPTLAEPPQEGLPVPSSPTAPTARPTGSAPATPSAAAAHARSTAAPDTSTPVATTAQPGRPTAASPRQAKTMFSMEAEALLTYRGGTTRTRHMAGASGDAVVERIGSAAANVVVFAAVTVAESGRYAVAFHYVTPERRSATVTANGVPMTVIFVVPDGGAETVGAMSIELRLKAGSNRIEFGNDTAPAPDLDRIVVAR